MRSPSSSISSSSEAGEELKKGAWTVEEDQKLMDYIEKHGQGSWQLLPKKAGLNRCGKSCRLRWTNYLRPDIKRGNFTHQEEQTIIHLHSLLGNKWSMIASRLPGRTDNEIKNYWNTHLRKRLIRSGIDPKTHQPIINYPIMLQNSLINNNTLENLAKIKLIYNILQVLQPNPSPSPIPIPLQNPTIPLLGQLQTLNQFNGLLDPTITNPLLQAVSSSSMQTNLHVPLPGESQPSFDAFGELPGLVDSENNGIGSTSKMSTADVVGDGNAAGGGGFDELDEILNYKGLGFGSNKSCGDDAAGWGEVIDDEASGGSCNWKDVLDEFFPSS